MSFAAPARPYGPPSALVSGEPVWRAPLPDDADPELRRLRPFIYEWIEQYHDRDHLTRAGDWMGRLAPGRTHLIVAALLHDMERSVPGGPRLEMASTPWDDPTYNNAHTARSAEIVSAWLAAHGASAELCAATTQPIREHEFGGSADGDLMQACDSISFLEANVGLVASWADRDMCTIVKAREKLVWMGTRPRLPAGRELAGAYLARALPEFETLLRTPEET